MIPSVSPVPFLPVLPSGAWILAQAQYWLPTLSSASAVRHTFFRCMHRCLVRNTLLIVLSYFSFLMFLPLKIKKTSHINLIPHKAKVEHNLEGFSIHILNFNICLPICQATEKFSIEIRHFQ